MAATAAASENFILSSGARKLGTENGMREGKRRTEPAGGSQAGSPAGRRPQQRERGW